MSTRERDVVVGVVVANTAIESPSFCDSEPPNYLEATQQQTYSVPAYTNLSPLNACQVFTIDGTLNRQKSNHHQQQLQQQQHEQQQSLATNSINKEPNDYLVWSIITCIYCIFIGITAVIFSLKIKELNALGRFELTHRQSKIVRNLNLFALLFACFYISVGLLFYYYPPSV